MSAVTPTGSEILALFSSSKILLDPFTGKRFTLDRFLETLLFNKLNFNLLLLIVESIRMFFLPNSSGIFIFETII